MSLVHEVAGLDRSINLTATQDTWLAEIIPLQAEKIQNMAAVMWKASEMNKEKVNGEMERISQ